MDPEVLTKAPLFAELDDASAEALERAMGSMRLAKGQILFREGETEDRLYVVVAGQLLSLLAERRGEVADWVGRQLDMRVEIDAIDGNMRLLTPVLHLRGVRIFVKDNPGEPALAAPAIDLEVADDSDNIVELKIMRLTDRSDDDLAMIEGEVIMHDTVSGIEGVVTLLDTFYDEMWCCLVLQYCSGGDLFDQCITKQVYQGNDELLRKAFLSIVDAVQGCHDLGIAHRDLKPENIFTSEDGSRCYLGDFSLATNQPIVCDFGVGTCQYRSPGTSTSLTPHVGVWC